MKLYTVRYDGIPDGFLIIARSISHAADIFATLTSAEDGALPETFTVAEARPPQLDNVLGDLLGLIRAGASGIVSFDDEQGFTLRPM